ncbi:reverse transcriptase domain-containing protein [Tanacetum coccineum]|uniref:Reverse transcriptase domain-containing protein n=1 Tax=Tanacetum coccineum TaxID=301880 RepID=A0ABQ4YRU0_9ASTR
MTVAPTLKSAIVRPDVDDNFVINSTHLKMIQENKFNGYLRADPHDHIREFLAICDMFKYGETQSKAVKLLIFPFSLCDDAKTWFNELNEESITSWEHMRRAFINRFFPPSLFNRLLLEIRNFSHNVCERLSDAWTDPPPPPQAHTEQVNAVFTKSGKSDDSPKIQNDPPPPIIVNNKIEKDQPIKTTKRGYHVIKTKEYPFHQKGKDEKVEKNSPKNIEPSKKKERKRYSHVHHVDKVAAVGSRWFMVRVMEENRRIHEDMELKRRSKLKLKASRHMFTVLAITQSYELGFS